MIDYSKEDGKKKLMLLLADADVLVTNIRSDALDRAGLSFDAIKADFPYLVYAHLSAWGRTGEDRGLPGYDFGAFCLGRSGAFTRPWRFFALNRLSMALWFVCMGAPGA